MDALSFLTEPSQESNAFRWCQFDACMLFFIVVSVLLQTLEIAGVAADYSPVSILRYLMEMAS